MKKNLIFLMVTVLMVTACQQKKYGGFTVTGTIKNATNSKIFLQELPYGGQEPIILDSGKIAIDNKFSLKGIAREEGLYRLVIENGPDVLIVNDNDIIEVEMDVNNYRAYKIIGSKASESLHTLFENYRKQDSALYLTFSRIDTLQKTPGNDSLLSIAKADRETQIKNINTSVRNFIKESNSPAARYYALGMASRTLNTDELKVLVNESADQFKEHSGLQKIKIALNTTATQKAPEPVAYALLNTMAPAISLPDVNGKTISLASFKGKYVLVDFWASWCGPCRRENPNVVAAYNQFKNKNFTVFGVSMDEDKSAWIEAIKADKLSWPQVSILSDWNSHPLTQEYQFNAIPFNVLIDPTGKIIASDLRGADLMNKLAELLK